VRSGRWWILFAVLAALTFFIGLATVALIVQAISGNVDKGSTRSGAIAGSVVLLIITAALGFATYEVEHRIRLARHSSMTGPWNPGGGAGPASPGSTAAGPWAATPGSTAGGPWSASPGPAPRLAGRTRGRRRSPHSRIGSLIFLTLLALVMVGVTVNEFVNWHQSQTVQHHGIQATGIVTEVVSIEHSTRSGHYDTTNLDVSLAPPVRGTTQTTVHTPDNHAPATAGQTITVLVDPSDPGYAELPGQSNYGITGAIIALVLAVVFLLLAGLALRAFVRARRVAQSRGW
jgi:Protein of unknown function (DUF3592)